MRLRLAHALFVLVAIFALPAAAGGLEHAHAGAKAEDEGNREEALRQYTRAIEAGDLNDVALAYVHLRRGAIRAYLGLRAAATEDFTAAIDRQPDHGLAYSMRGYQRGAAGDDEAAERDHKMAVDLASTAGSPIYLAWVLQHYADLRRRQRRFDEALEIANRSIAALEYSDAYFRRAWIYLDMHRPDEARADYKRFLELVASERRSPADYYWPDEREAVGRLKVLSDLK